MTAFDPALSDSRARSASANANFAQDVRAGVARHFEGLDDADAVLAQARKLFTDGDWIAALIQPLVDGLRADPWFSPALRVTRDALRTAVVLADLPEVTLTASVTSATALARLALPATLVVSGRRALILHVRGGEVTVRRWRLAGTMPPRCDEVEGQLLRDGDLVELDGRFEGRLIVAATREVQSPAR